MFYQKNVPVWERILRVVAGLIVIALTLAFSPSGWLSALIIASAAIFVFFGFVGYCPMCALAGRKLTPKK